MDSANSPTLFSLHCARCEKDLGKIDNQTVEVYCKDCYEYAEESEYWDE